SAAVFSLSLHAALPIYRNPKTLFVADFIGETNKLGARATCADGVALGDVELRCAAHAFTRGDGVIAAIRPEDVTPHAPGARPDRSEEHTSELQSRENLV